MIFRILLIAAIFLCVSNSFAQQVSNLGPIAGIGYLIDSFANFLMPNYTDFANIFLIVVVVPGVVGELSLTFWLLFKGVSDQAITSEADL